MNITTLTKCVEELKKETPNISYVLGMLETVIEIHGGQTIVTQIPSSISTITSKNTVVSSGSGLVADLSDEEILAQRYAGGPVGNVQ